MCDTRRRPAGRFLLLFAALAALLCPFAPEGLAALRPKQAEVSMDDAVNPRPEAGDLMLPMPCGASMAFRAVGVQASGFLDDMETLFGCDECDRQDRDYYERRYSTAVSGPFSASDLPEQWRGSLPSAANAEGYYYYLIGKYEVSAFQWKALMQGWCPSAESPLSPEDARPATDISWFDAVNFAKTYTEWLLANAPDSLPRFGGDTKNVGYLRLPTEAEWEYAARGGHAVPRASLREQEFFPMKDGETYSRYAVYRAEEGGAESMNAIGSRSPNPLGLYDTAGNAAEMVMDSFHFSLGGRLHGSAGGFVRKGGSFLSSAGEILPGRREEAAHFIADGPGKARDLGFRLALSGINTPAGTRPALLAKEWKKIGEGTGLLLDQGKNPLEELDRLITATNNPQEKENLTRLRSVLKDNNIALERQNAMAAESLIRSALFMVETVRNYGVRHKGFVSMIEQNMPEREKAKKMSPAVQKAVEATIADLQQNRAAMERALEAAVGFYRSKVEESLNYPEELFNAKLALIGAEFSGDDILTRNMRQAHALFSGHTKMMRLGQRSKLTRELLLRDILPENLREGLRGDKE